MFRVSESKERPREIWICVGPWSGPLGASHVSMSAPSDSRQRKAAALVDRSLLVPGTASHSPAIGVVAVSGILRRGAILFRGERTYQRVRFRPVPS